MLLHGFGCKANVAKGIELLQEAFDNGEVSSCDWLGHIYGDGQVVPRDVAKARAYYEEGVKRGMAECAEGLRKLDEAK